MQNLIKCTRQLILKFFSILPRKDLSPSHNFQFPSICHGGDVVPCHSDNLANLSCLYLNCDLLHDERRILFQVVSFPFGLKLCE